MPSFLHEAMVELFRNRVGLAAELLGHLGVRLPRFAHTEVKDADLGELLPTEHSADLVVLMTRKAAKEAASLSRDEDVPVFGCVVEVQLAPDPDKPFVWPLYASVLRARWRCPCAVLVIAPLPSVARWAAKPVDTGQPGCPFQPPGVGPSRIPRIVDPEIARRNPEMAVLSAMAHGRDQSGLPVAEAASTAVLGLDDLRSVVYWDAILLAASETVRHALEENMRVGDYQVKSESAKRYFKELREEGARKGRAESVLRVLSARGLEPTESQRSTVLQCEDLATLDRWLERAVTASTPEDLFH